MNIWYIWEVICREGTEYNILALLLIMGVVCGIFIITNSNPVLSVIYLIGLFLAISVYLVIIGLYFIGLFLAISVYLVFAFNSSNAGRDKTNQDNSQGNNSNEGNSNAIKSSPSPQSKVPEYLKYELLMNIFVFFLIIFIVFRFIDKVVIITWKDGFQFIFIVCIWALTVNAIFINWGVSNEITITDKISAIVKNFLNDPIKFLLLLVIIISISLEIRLPLITYFTKSLGYSYYFALLNTFSLVWLPLRILFSIVSQYLDFILKDGTDDFWLIVTRIDYTQCLKGLNAKGFFLGFLMVTTVYSIKITFIFIYNIFKLIYVISLSINGAAFKKDFTEWLTSYRGLNWKYRMPISTRLFLKESSSKVLHSAYNNYRSHFQPYTLPKLCPRELSKMYTISIETKEGSLITLNISDDETLIESVESDSPTLVINSNLYFKVSQGVKNSNLASKFSTESWIKNNAEVFLKSPDPQLYLSPEYLVENRVQTVLINTAQGKSVECNSDNSQIIRSSNTNKITINKSGSASNFVYGQSSNMGSILPIRDMTDGEFSTFVFNLSMKRGWYSGHLMQYLENTRRTDWASFCNFKSFLLSHKLNFISVSEDDSQFSYWIIDYSAFLDYLKLKNIPIDSFDEIFSTHYINYKFFLHFLSTSYGNMDLIRDNEMDKETFDLNFSKFSQYPTNKIILKLLPKLLIELSNLNNVIKIYFPLKEGGWDPTELQVNQLNKINLKWVCNISSIFLDSRVNISEFLKSYDSVSNFLSSFNLSGSLFDLLSNERGCSELDTLLIDLGNKVEEYSKQFDNSRDLLNIVQGIQNNTQESLNKYGLLFLSEVKLESQGTREGIVLSQIDSELPPSNENNIVLETESELPPSNEEGAHYNDKSVTLKKSPVKFSKATQEIIDSIKLRMGEGDNGEGRVNLDQGLRPDQPFPRRGIMGDLESRRDEINTEDADIKRKKVKGGVNRRARLDEDYGYIYGENPYNPQPPFDPVRNAAAQPAEEVLAPQPPFDPVRNAAAQPAEEVLAPQPPFDPVRNAASYNGAAALPLPAPYGLVVAKAQYEQLAPAGYTGGEGYSFSESKADIAKRIIGELPNKGRGRGLYDENATINQLLPRCVKSLSPGDRTYLDEFIRTNHRYTYDSIVHENTVDKSIVIDYSKMTYEQFCIVRMDLISVSKN